MEARPQPRQDLDFVHSDMPFTSPPREHHLLRILVVLFLGLVGIAALMTWWFGAPWKAAQPQFTGAGVVPAPNVSAHEEIADIEVVQYATANQTNERSIAYIRMPGNTALNASLYQFVAHQTQVFEVARAPGSNDGELNIGWEIPVASGQILGVRMIGTMHVGDDTPNVGTQTFYGQMGDGQAAGSAALLSLEGRDEATRLIVLALRAAGMFALGGSGVGDGTPAEDVHPDDAIFSDIVFDSEGAGIMTLPTGLLTEPSQGQVAVRISPALTPGLLTDLGLQVREAYVRGTPFVGVRAGVVDESPGNDVSVHGTVQGPSTVTVEGVGGATVAPKGTVVTKAAAKKDDAAKKAAAKKAAAKKKAAKKDDAAKKKAAKKKAAKKDSKKKAPAKKTAKKKAAKKVDCKKKKCIALTFDDGPGQHTDSLLKSLRKAKVPATFFLVGRNVGIYPKTVKRMAKDGHEIGNHTWSHPDLRRLKKAAVSKQLSSTSKAIKKVTGKAPTLVRPPYGATNPLVYKVLKQRGEPAILWDVDTQDWSNKSVSVTTSRALAGATRGSIVLMHDVHPSTVKATPKIIKALKKRGYVFVTVSDLLGSTKGGKGYYRR